MLGALFLGASLGVTGLLCGKTFAMNGPPWQSFLVSTGFLRAFADAPSIKQLPDEAFNIAQNASDLAACGSWPFAILFTIYFAAVVVLSTALLVSLSVAVSRFFLREMISAQTPFRILMIFVSSTALLIMLAGAASLVLFVLLNVWTWPFLPLIFAMSKASLWLGAGRPTPRL